MTAKPSRQTSTTSAIKTKPSSTKGRGGIRNKPSSSSAMPPWARVSLPVMQHQSWSSALDAMVKQQASKPATVVLAYYAGLQKEGLDDIQQAIDQATAGAIQRALTIQDLNGERGNVTVLYPSAGFARVLMIGLGKKAPASDQSSSSLVHDKARKDAVVAIRAAAKQVAGLSAQQLYWALTAQSLQGLATDDLLTLSARCLVEALYQFKTCKSSADDDKPHQAGKSAKAATLTKGPSAVIFGTPATSKRSTEAWEQAIKHGLAVGEGVNFARELGNLPGNICTPSYLADTAKRLAKTFNLGCTVLEASDMKALGMGSLLSVAEGSEQPAKFIVLQYPGQAVAAASTKTGRQRGAQAKAPVVLVGKGITFDTGGISLKPGADMDEMKFDMCGAASVLGSLYAIAQLGLAQPVVAIVPTTENMPSGRATKPGDIVTAMSGKTIEILNTDAEGRLILCDAITYAERFKPAALVDVATLTGACVIALGQVNTGLFANHDGLAQSLTKAGQQAADPVWRMPLGEEYHEQLKSNFADVANIGGRMAGSVTAACFLEQFVGDYPWAHLDIAGTAWQSGKAKGATGRPVPLLVEFIAQFNLKPSTLAPG